VADSSFIIEAEWVIPKLGPYRCGLVSIDLRFVASINEAGGGFVEIATNQRVYCVEGSYSDLRRRWLAVRG
jgi:hypothetical protein